MRPFILRPAAEAEVEEAYHWYEDRNPGLGAEFVRAVDVVVAVIRRHPKRHPEVYKHARQAVLRRFPYSIYYIIQPDDSSEVISCFHTRRNPRKWRSRA